MNNYPCRVSADLKLWELGQRTDAQQELIDEQIAARAEELIKPGEEHYPFGPINFSDAMDGSIAFDEIIDALQEHDYAAAGRILANKLIERARKLALLTAEYQIDGGY